MDMSRMAMANLKLRHQHKDGSWDNLVRDAQHHGPADHDAERGWAKGWVFRCVSCPEVVMIEMPDEPPPGKR